MLSANQFDRIKASIKLWRGMKVGDLTLDMVGSMLQMLDQCAQEIDRLRQPTQVGGRGHLKPVVLDAKGQAIAPPPIAHQLQLERRAQYDADRLEAVMAVPNTDPWRVFSLRWGLAPPPGGWEQTDMILRVIHTVRLGIKEVPYIDKHFSATYLTSNGIHLPPGVQLTGGILRGVEIPE